MYKYYIFSWFVCFGEAKTVFSFSSLRTNILLSNLQQLLLDTLFSLDTHLSAQLLNNNSKNWMPNFFSFLIFHTTLFTLLTLIKSESSMTTFWLHLRVIFSLVFSLQCFPISHATGCSSLAV